MHFIVGLRGELPCVLLQRLHAAFPYLVDDVDLFAGTSNGGDGAIARLHGSATNSTIVAMLAAGMAMGLEPAGCRCVTVALLTGLAARSETFQQSSA